MVSIFDNKILSQKFCNLLFIFQIDETVVIHCPDEILRKHGVVTDGDIIKLRIKCSKDGINARKKELKAIFTSKSIEHQPAKKKPFPKLSPISHETTTTEIPTKLKCRVINITWEHYDPIKAKYAGIRSERGGGLSKFKFPLTASRDEVFQEIINYFWQRKNDKDFGDRSDYHMFLYDAKRQTIPDFLTDGQGNLVPFSIKTFCEQNKLARPRMFFQTKLKSFNTKMLDEFISQHSSSEEISFTSSQVQAQLNHSITMSTPLSQSKGSFSLPPIDYDDMDNISTAAVSSFSGLIGSSEERDRIKSDINKAFEASLELDKQKDLEISNR